MTTSVTGPTAITRKIMPTMYVRVGIIALTLLTTGLTSCGDLLTVPEDPTQIQDADVNDAAGADLLRRGALFWQSYAVASGARSSGLLADEFMRDGPRVLAPSSESAQALADMRQSELYEQKPTSESDTYLYWQFVREAANVALPKIEAYSPSDVRGPYIAQMFALRGFASLRLAEYICPGFPLHDVVDYRVVVSAPLSTDQALERSLADFDTAMTLSADSVRILNFARVGRARALLNLGRFSEAAAAVAAVPTEFVYHAEYNVATANDENEVSPSSFFWGGNTVADREGGSGLPFVSANDPRVGLTPLGTARDGTTPLYGVAKYPTTESPIVIASGVEARLIEAEAALAADDPKWLTILNDLRSAQVSPALEPMADPATPTARVDMLFRERAFWLFATGSRLGDLRRLIRQYGRSSDSVFPSGAYWRGGAYGTATSIPFPARLETPFNPAVTGCTAR